MSTNIKFNAFQCKKEFVDRRQKEREYLLTSRNEPTTTTELELLKGQQQKKGMDVGARLCGHEGEGGGLECTPCYAMCAAADAALVHRSAMQTRGSLDLTRTAVSMFTVYLGSQDLKRINVAPAVKMNVSKVILVSYFEL